MRFARQSSPSPVLLLPVRRTLQLVTVQQRMFCPSFLACLREAPRGMIRRFRRSTLPAVPFLARTTMRNVTNVTPADLELLRRYDTPTVCNVIELFDVRPRTAGYMDGRIKACYPNLPP